MYVLDSSNINTEPGAHLASPFSPPKGWEGDSKDYVNLLKKRYRCVDFYQRMYSVAKFARQGSIRVTGPFANEAKRVIEAMRNTIK